VLLALALLALPQRLLARLPAVTGWLAASPTASGGTSTALLTGLAAAAPDDGGITLGDVAPIVIALIAAAGTVTVAVINNRRSRPAPQPPAEDVPTSASVRVLEANIATVRREGVDGRAALRTDVDEVRAEVARLHRRLDEHLDRGTGRIPAQRGPTD